jgi:hypothetical protein
MVIYMMGSVWTMEHGLTRIDGGKKEGASGNVHS